MISIWYDETISTKNVPDAIGIRYTNCGNNIGCSLKNQTIYTFITTIATNMVSSMLVYLGSYSQTKNSIFIFRSTVLMDN